MPTQTPTSPPIASVSPRSSTSSHYLPQVDDNPGLGGYPYKSISAADVETVAIMRLCLLRGTADN
jgi:hypothetical protein